MPTSYGVEGDVATVGEDAGLDAAHVAGSDDPQAERLAGLPDPVPQAYGVAAGVLDVDLEADLGGVAGARDHHLHPVEVVLGQPVVADVEDTRAEDLSHHRGRLRTLHLHRADVGLPDLDVVAEPVGDAACPQQDVAVGQREPEMVLRQAQQHRVVEDATCLVGEEDVLALADLALGEVAGHQQVGEVERVGSGDLDLPLHAGVPEGDAGEQRPVLGDRVTVVPWMVGPVVDAVHRDTVLA